MVTQNHGQHHCTEDPNTILGISLGFNTKQTEIYSLILLSSEILTRSFKQVDYQSTQWVGLPETVQYVAFLFAKYLGHLQKRTQTG